MSCCCSNVGAAAERQFSEKRAAEDLAQYRTKGLGSTARLLLAGIAKAGQPHGRLLDVGSGIGALTFELLERGLTEATGVDLSSAYVAAASEEAARRGRTASVRFVHGDFVAIASQLVAADIVTLDRVICCYPEYERLLDESARHATGGPRATQSQLHVDLVCRCVPARLSERYFVGTRAQSRRGCDAHVPADSRCNSARTRSCPPCGGCVKERECFDESK